MPDRRARAERLRDVFELQLRFAQHMAERTGTPLGQLVLSATNFHRRFGFGDPDRGVSPKWNGYVRELALLRDITERVAWTQDFFATAPDETLPAQQRFFGCFGFEQPDAQGVVRIHFIDTDNDDIGPLHRSKVTRRRSDLAEMVAAIRATCPDAATIRGVSWLYHLEAYRRLFPPDYGASRRPAEPVRLSGMSSWGQFLTHTGAIKPALRDAFLQSFDTMDVTAPWRSFPLPALTVAAPLAVFEAYYAH
jgi:hypothetical protein